MCWRDAAALVRGHSLRKRCSVETKFTYSLPWWEGSASPQTLPGHCCGLVKKIMRTTWGRRGNRSECNYYSSTACYMIKICRCFLIISIFYKSQMSLHYSQPNCVCRRSNSCSIISLRFFMWFHLISFIFVTQDNDHMVWSTNRTYNNKNIAHSMVKIQERLFK